MSLENDTIAAISTPAGTGGIAVIRVSGPAAIFLVDRLFRAKTELTKAKPRQVYFGNILDPTSSAEVVVDEVLVTLFRAPRSYTREDVVEISCHGGHFVSNRILELIVEAGARLAEPGEFTQRAFLNGRLDLSRAEAVADIIRARTELSLKAAQSQFQGGLSRQIREMREKLIAVCSLLELELDFAEEDVAFANHEQVTQRVDSTIESVEAFLATYERGKILRDGARLVITGKPNVGKSSLLNALLKEERAIVTEIPGTTRDVLEEQLDIRGVLFRVVDTAGVRGTSDRVEKLGVDRSLDQIKQADLVLVLFDGSRRIDQQDRELIDRILSLREGSKRCGAIAAINKIDVEQKLSKEDVRRHLGGADILELSAKEHLGIRELEASLVAHTVGAESLNGDPMISNLRQKQALAKAVESLKAARASLEKKLSAEFVALDLRQALDSLGEIIGEVTSEDILGNIFSKFCIGK